MDGEEVGFFFDCELKLGLLFFYFYDADFLQMVFYLEGDVVFGEVEHFVDLFEVVEGGQSGIGGD